VAGGGTGARVSLFLQPGNTFLFLSISFLVFGITVIQNEA
jgi:hypothetical protein